MKKFIVSSYVISLLAALLCLLSSQAFCQQRSLEKSLKVIDEMRIKLTNYSQDLQDFDKANLQQNEKALAADLASISLQTENGLQEVRTLLLVYSTITLKNDRAIARPIIQVRLNELALDIDLNVTGINGFLSISKSPMLVELGTRLKADLREIKSFFESLELSL